MKQLVHPHYWQHARSAQAIGNPLGLETAAGNINLAQPYNFSRIPTAENCWVPHRNPAVKLLAIKENQLSAFDNTNLRS